MGAFLKNLGGFVVLWLVFLAVFPAGSPLMHGILFLLLIPLAAIKTLICYIFNLNEIEKYGQDGSLF